MPHQATANSLHVRTYLLINLFLTLILKCHCRLCDLMPTYPITSTASLRYGSTPKAFEMPQSPSAAMMPRSVRPTLSNMSRSTLMTNDMLSNTNSWSVELSYAVFLNEMLVADFSSFSFSFNRHGIKQSKCSPQSVCCVNPKIIVFPHLDVRAVKVALIPNLGAQS